MKLRTASGIFIRCSGMVLLAGGISLAIMGILDGQPLDVLHKATRICLECIGLG